MVFGLRNWMKILQRWKKKNKNKKPLGDEWLVTAESRHPSWLY